MKVLRDLIRNAILLLDDDCEPWIEFNNLLSDSSITSFGNNDLNPYKPPSNNY